MIIVRVELHSAITGQRTELARAVIANEGTGTKDHADYACATLRGRGTAQLDRGEDQRRGHVLWYPRLRLHVWNLVAEALAGMGYGRRDRMQPKGPNPLAAVEAAIAAYHAALDAGTRAGPVAADALRAIEAALNTPHEPGEEAARRLQLVEAGTNA